MKDRIVQLCPWGSPHNAVEIAHCAGSDQVHDDDDDEGDGEKDDTEGNREPEVTKTGLERDRGCQHPCLT